MEAEHASIYEIRRMLLIHEAFAKSQHLILRELLPFSAFVLGMDGVEGCWLHRSPTGLQLHVEDVGDGCR